MGHTMGRGGRTPTDSGGAPFKYSATSSRTIVTKRGSVPAVAARRNGKPNSSAKCWASFLEEPNSGGAGFLMVFGEFVPLCDELVCDLDCPRHTVIRNIRIC